MTAEALTSRAPDSPPPPGGHGKKPTNEPDSNPAVPSVFAGVAIIAVAADILGRSGAASVATAVMTCVVVGVLVATGQVRSKMAGLALATAIAFAAWLPFRASPWLVPFNLLVIFGLVAVGTVFHQTQDLTVRSFTLLRRATGALLRSGGAGPAFLAKPIVDGVKPRHMKKIFSLGLGLALATPIVTILTTLLASADAVFASLLRPGFSAESIVGHVFLLALGAVTGTLLLHRASTPPPLVEAPARRRLLGATETAVVLGAVVVVFGAFVIAQVVTAAGGADHILETAGLTRAEYAREGFFQLLAVSALSLGLVMSSSHRVSGTSPARRVAALGVAVSTLTIAIVAVSIIRLMLYVDAFGLTMLRLYTLVFAAWIGVVFLCVIGKELGIQWLVSRQGASIVASGLAMLFALNVMNPEAFVVRHNVDHGAVRFDAFYAADLSVDALPALAEAARDHPELREAIEEAVCHRAESAVATNWLGSLSGRSAKASRQELCADAS